MSKEQDLFLDDLVTTVPANILNSKPFTLDVRSYAGYAPFAQPRFRGELFYWFFESRSVIRPKDNLDWQPPKKELEKIPLLIWLNGGPGGSSEFGLFCENGPLTLSNDAAGTISRNPFSWNERAHVLYWDQPVGTGYSRSRSGKDYVTSEVELSEQFYYSLQAFFARHPEYRGCQLYITGESYAGKYIPSIATEIVKKNKEEDPDNKADSDHINLAGIAIGDGWMDPRRQLKWVIDYGFNLGFLDTLQKEKMLDLWKPFDEACEKGEWDKATDLGNALNGAILACAGEPDMYDIREWADTSGQTVDAYLNTDGVKDALHIPGQDKWVTADDSGPVTEALKADNMQDITPLFPALLNATDGEESKYRLLFYTGNFDMSACGFTGTENILQALDWNHQEEWKALKRKVWVTPPSATIGFVKSFANLTQVVVPGAGHLVPMNRPKVSLKMLNTWLFDSGKFPAYEPLHFLLKDKE